MKAKLKNIITGKTVSVHSTTDSIDSSYGLECWVDNKGTSYGQCQFGAPFGWALIECDTDPKDFMLDMRAKWAKGGSAKSEEKQKASRENGKKGGRPKSKKEID